MEQETINQGDFQQLVTDYGPGGTKTYEKKAAVAR